MTKEGKRLKDTYKTKLWIFIAVNIAVLWGMWVKGTFDEANTTLLLKKFLSPKALLFPLIPVLTTTLSGLIPQTVKEFLVFFRIRDRLPGCRAFSIWAKKDFRIRPKPATPERPEVRDQKPVKSQFTNKHLFLNVCITIIFSKLQFDMKNIYA